MNIICGANGRPSCLGSVSCALKEEAVSSFASHRKNWSVISVGLGTMAAAGNLLGSDMSRGHSIVGSAVVVVVVTGSAVVGASVGAAVTVVAALVVVPGVVEVIGMLVVISSALVVGAAVVVAAAMVVAACVVPVVGAATFMHET